MGHWVLTLYSFISCPRVALVIYNDDILSDEASWIKDIKLSDDERTFHEEYATAHPTHAQDEHNVDTLPPFVPLHPSSSLVSMPLDLPTFASDASVVVHNNNFLFDEAEHEYDIDTLPPFFPFHTSSSPVSQSMSLDLPIFASTCNHEPACTTPDKHEHHGDFNILPVTTTAIDVNYGPSLRTLTLILTCLFLDPHTLLTHWLRSRRPPTPPEVTRSPSQTNSGPPDSKSANFSFPIPTAATAFSLL
ncbi:uncharacterized protein EDB91DRAFT_750876 [Suillus paluster]|uniref:uncharacterized protein n=1 Tax=Suillus paluster TaxID=48578 RepID=UPI001B8740EE|nr:uncharacterized protein EDB91DRAFT_750876 [Suillus paluster]KAG1730714.1 hypothetical protein EDB91DRAFT_750876 [Suillus paluster]